MKHGSSTMPIENFTTEIVNNGKTLRAKLPGPLAPGVYTVEYRAVGGDHHPMTAHFRFTVRCGATNVRPVGLCTEIHGIPCSPCAFRGSTVRFVGFVSLGPPRPP